MNISIRKTNASHFNTVRLRSLRNLKDVVFLMVFPHRISGSSQSSYLRPSSLAFVTCLSKAFSMPIRHDWSTYKCIALNVPDCTVKITSQSNHDCWPLESLGVLVPVWYSQITNWWILLRNEVERVAGPN